MSVEGENMTTSYAYDELGRVEKVTENLLDNEKSFTFGYTYTSKGELESEIYPNEFKLVYEYDNRGFLKWKADGSNGNA